MIECIALFPVGDSRGSRNLLDLTTGRVITRSKFIPLPMPRQVIKRMTDLSARESLSISKKLNDWKSTEDADLYDEEFPSGIEQMSETEISNYKEITDDQNFDLNHFTADDNLMQDDFVDDTYPDVPAYTLEEQSDLLLDTYQIEPEE
jgi:hypothetical protein